MSVNFHANQYEQAFTPHRLQNWEIPQNEQGKYPKPQSGFTRIKANDRGHLLPNVPRERSSPWGSHVGTWDMPNKIPGNRVLNPTARCEDAVIKGHHSKQKANVVISGALKRCHTVEPLPVKADAGMYDQQPPMMEGPPKDYIEPPCPVVGVKSPVGQPLSPKPVTPMACAEGDVQEEARKLVSPLAQNNANAAAGGLKTPDADLQNRAEMQPSPKDRIVGMKSPTDLPQPN